MRDHEESSFEAWAGTGFFLIELAVEERWSKGDMNSNIDRRGDGGLAVGCWGTCGGSGGAGGACDKA